MYRLRSLERPSESSILNVLAYIAIIVIPVLPFLPEINVLYFWVIKDFFASNALTALSTIQIQTVWVLVSWQLTYFWIMWHGYAVYNQIAYLVSGYFHLKCFLLAALGFGSNYYGKMTLRDKMMLLGIVLILVTIIMECVFLYFSLSTSGVIATKTIWW
nr:hypothetical protein [Candidatus Freyarchaeota archaeon]